MATCRCCGEAIRSTDPRRRFCSRTCAARTNNAGVARNVTSGRFARKPCEQCAKLTTNPRYCSTRCAAAGRRAEGFAAIRRSGRFRAPTTARAFLAHRDGWRCSICHRITWLGQPIPLVLDHINGNPEDDRIDNVRLVCGNCDMQLPTYKSRNRGNGRAWRRRRYAEGRSY